IRAVTQAAVAAGKTINAADLRKIEQRIAQARKDLGASDPNYASKTPGEQVQQAAQRVAQDIVAQKKKNAVNIAQQIVRHDRNQANIAAMAAKGVNRFAALRRIAT